MHADVELDLTMLEAELEGEKQEGDKSDEDKVCSICSQPSLLLHLE
jgi:hypothetical protein